MNILHKKYDSDIPINNKVLDYVFGQTNSNAYLCDEFIINM